MRLALVLAALLFTACGREKLARPRNDPALHDWPAAAAVDFAHAKPALLPATQALLTVHWDGLRSDCFPDELEAEIQSFYQTLPRDRRRDSSYWLPNHVPKDWAPARTWYAGGIEGGVQLLYANFGATPCLEDWNDGQPPPEPMRQRHASLGWASSAQPAELHWIERELALSEFLGIRLCYDVETHDGAIVLVCGVSSGLREIVFEPEGAGLRVQRDRPLGSAKAFDPMLLDAGGTLLLFWSEFQRAGSRFAQGGRALRVARLEPGAQEWSAPATLTIELGCRGAACARDDQITAAWGDDRYREYTWSAFKNTRKLCVARSLDGGATWSAPVLLHAPENERDGVEGSLRVFDDGARILVLDTEVPMDAQERAYVLSRDLTRLDPQPADLKSALLELRQSEIAAMNR